MHLHSPSVSPAVLSGSNATRVAQTGRLMVGENEDLAASHIVPDGQRICTRVFLTSELWSTTDFNLQVMDRCYRYYRTLNRCAMKQPRESFKAEYLCRGTEGEISKKSKASLEFSQHQPKEGKHLYFLRQFTHTILPSDVASKSGWIIGDKTF